MASDPVFFWKDTDKNGHLSQSYRCIFTDPAKLDIGTFNSAEHWMMYTKALAFNDQATAADIATRSTLQEQRRLGYQVEDFNAETWWHMRERVVEKGNYLKFSRCTTTIPMLGVGGRVEWKRLRDLLLETKDRELVEAGPFDRVWGIGFEADRALTTPRELWGQNLLGKALMKVRERLLEEAEEAEAAAEAEAEAEAEAGGVPESATAST